MKHIPTISLVMIHRRAGDRLLEAVGSALDHVDEVVLVDTGPNDDDDAAKAARKYIAQSIEPECAARGINFKQVNYRGPEFLHDGRRYTADFSAARNFAHGLATKEWEFFLDADDILQWDGDWNLRKLISEVHAKHLGVGEISMPYAYQPGLEQDRVRLWKRSLGWEWRGALHEERHPLAPGRFTRCQLTSDEGFFVEHRGDGKASHARNAALLKHLWDTGRYDEFTPQMVCAFFAQMLDYKYLYILDLEMPEDASRDALALFHALRAEACRRLGRENDMLAELGAAVALAPDDRAHWAELGLEWASSGRDNAKPSAALALKHAFLVLPETWRYLAPTGWFEGEAREKAARFLADVEEYGVASHIAAGNDAVWRKVSDEIKAQEHRVLRRGRKMVGTPVRRFDRIDFLVSSPVEGWGPLSDKVVGGSELAVLEVAPRLARLGIETHVWALGLGTDDVGAKEHAMGGGVVLGAATWHDLADFDPSTPTGAVVVWRDARRIPGCRGFGHPVWLWAHDIPEVFGAEGLHAADKVFALSKHHLRRFAELGVDEEKLVLSQNGLDPGDVQEAWDAVVKNGVRDPHRAVYCSSANRGLMLLLDAWPAIRQQVPDATLDVCYGLEMFRRRDTPPRLRGFADWVEQRCATLEPQGVIFRGATPHADLLRILGSSGVWAYPCVFEEIFCIAAIEAQAMGCWPVTITSAALAETVHGGSLLPLRQLQDECDLSPEERALGEVWTTVHPASRAYVEAVANAMLKPPFVADRANLSASMLSIYDWAHVAAHFARALEMEKNNDGSSQDLARTARLRRDQLLP
ncbi:MAG: glycosyltransferase [Dehalococcoidia bacterium]|jgi:glycosyltransferase involved in cell wall biosynthesis|nr:glycosyltransferase [Dehalococcoidia bacterium]